MPWYNWPAPCLNAVGGVWTGGAGAFLPSNSNLNATYTPTAAELTAGPGVDQIDLHRKWSL
jgi:hypothetical protein